jgi:predicted TIM-barrel fold metal-dependent hydrolase
MTPREAPRPALNIAALTAIDVHVHAESASEDTAADRAAQRYFGAGGVPTALDDLAAYYRERSMACVVFSVDERLSQRPVVPNADVIAAARANPDVIIPFASVDPTRGRAAVDEAVRLIAEGAVRGSKSSCRTTAPSTRSTKRSRRLGCPSCSIPGTAASGPACAAVAAYA